MQQPWLKAEAGGGFPDENWLIKKSCAAMRNQGRSRNASGPAARFCVSGVTFWKVRGGRVVWLDGFVGTQAL